MTNTTIVWPYWADGANGDELRYSMRSVFENVRGKFNVAIIGDRPPWFEGLFIPSPLIKPAEYFEHVGALFNHRWRPIVDRVWKLGRVAECDQISDRFVWFSDDVFVMKETPIDYFTVPRYFGKCKTYRKPRTDRQELMNRTVGKLERMKLSRRSYSTHHPQPFERHRIGEYFEAFDPLVAPAFVETLWHNWSGHAGETNVRGDFQFMNWCRLDYTLINITRLRAAILSMVEVLPHHEAKLAERFAKCPPWESE